MLKPSDIRALHMRRDVARIERIMETMPAELKEEYMAAVSAMMGPRMNEFFGYSKPCRDSRSSNVSPTDITRKLEQPGK